MPIPKAFMFYAPVVKALIDGNIHSIDEIKKSVAENMRLSTNSLEELLPSGRDTVFNYRLKVALQDLVKKGAFVEKESRDHYKLTEAGMRLTSDPNAIESNSIRLQILLKEQKRLGDKIREIVSDVK